MARAGEREVAPIEVRNWVGLKTNLSPHAMPPGGARQQTNMIVIRPGVLETRGGFRPVEWAN